MHCPRCDVEVLAERTRDGVTIDVCGRCRGVWLDRGELERLIARAAPPDSEPGFGPPGRRDDDRRRDDRRRDDDDDDDGPRGGIFGTLRNLFD